MSKTFANNLRNYRLLMHMTQTDLGNAVDSNRGTINNYEQGRSEPSFEMLCKMADVLGVSIVDLVTEHETFPDFVRRYQLTDEEAALIDAYREADPIYQGVALTILREHKKNG